MPAATYVGWQCQDCPVRSRCWAWEEPRQCVLGVPHAVWLLSVRSDPFYHDGLGVRPATMRWADRRGARAEALTRPPSAAAEAWPLRCGFSRKRSSYGAMADLSVLGERTPDPRG
jgi:hypothetical protein